MYTIQMIIMLHLYYFKSVGAITTFVPSSDLTVLCFNLGTVLFAAYFPFRAREFESKGRYNYTHIAAVASAVIFSGMLVSIQFALGGYSRTVVPIFCLADPSNAFVFAVIPACVISAIFLTIVMLLLFKIFDIGQWKFKTRVRILSLHVHVNNYYFTTYRLHGRINYAALLRAFGRSIELFIAHNFVNVMVFALI